MKKLILTLTLAATIASAYGQGTVAFSNNPLSRHSILNGLGNIQVPTTPGVMKYGLWYGVGSASAVNSNAAPWIIGVNSTTGAGLIASSADGKTPLSNVPLGPETSINEHDIWVQIIAWSAQYLDWQSAKAAWDVGTINSIFAMTDVRNIPYLGNPEIAGGPVWQGAPGTNPNLFNPFQIIIVIPEPSSITLAGLGAVALLVARRRR